MERGLTLTSILFFWRGFMAGRWWKRRGGGLKVRAVVRVQFCACTKTMMVVYCLTGALSGIEIVILG